METFTFGNTALHQSSLYTMSHLTFLPEGEYTGYGDTTNKLYAHYKLTTQAVCSLQMANVYLFHHSCVFNCNRLLYLSVSG